MRSIAMFIAEVHMKEKAELGRLQLLEMYTCMKGQNSEQDGRYLFFFSRQVPSLKRAIVVFVRAAHFACNSMEM